MTKTHPVRAVKYLAGALSFRKLRRPLAAVVSVVYFLTQAVFAHAAETNFWAERKKAQAAARPMELPRVLHSLPSPVSPALNQSLPRNIPPTLRDSLGALSLAYGSVRKIDLPNGTPGAVVLHIQDIHQNAEAQNNISRMVQDLMDREAVQLLALEGSSEPIDLSLLHSAPDQDTVHRVADFLLQENDISGAVHAALLTAKRLPPIQGVEAPDRYAANVDAYRRSAPVQSALKSRAAEAARDLAERKRAMFNPALLAFDLRVQSYRDGKLSFGDYAKTVAEGAAPRNTDVRNFLESLAMEDSLDFAAVERERAELLQRLTAKLSAEQSDRLLQWSLAYKAGNVRYAEFYGYLRDLCQGARHPDGRRNDGGLLSDFPAFDRYIRYVLLADAIDVEGLDKGLRALEESRYRELVRKPEEEKLLAEARRIHLDEKLLDFALTPEEWKEYQKTVAGGSRLVTSHLSPFTNHLLDLSSFESFYQEADARSAAMVENLMKAVAGQGKTPATRHQPRVAVLVTGGFHGADMAAALTKTGAAVVSVIPKITKVDAASGSTYLSVFTREKSPLEKIFEGQKLFLAHNPASPFAQVRARLLYVARQIWLAGPGAGDNTIAEIIRPWRLGDVRFKLTQGRVLAEQVPVVARDGSFVPSHETHSALGEIKKSPRLRFITQMKEIVQKPGRTWAAGAMHSFAMLGLSLSYILSTTPTPNPLLQLLTLAFLILEIWTLINSKVGFSAGIAEETTDSPDSAVTRQRFEDISELAADLSDDSVDVKNAWASLQALGWEEAAKEFDAFSNIIERTLAPMNTADPDFVLLDWIRQSLSNEYWTEVIDGRPDRPVARWRASMEKRPKVRIVLTLFQLPDGRVVVQRRAPHLYDKPGNLGLHGGHVGYGKTPLEAAIEEIDEETPLGKLSPNRFKPVPIRNGHNPFHETTYYRVQLTEEEWAILEAENEKLRAFWEQTLKESRVTLEELLAKTPEGADHRAKLREFIRAKAQQLNVTTSHLEVLKFECKPLEEVIPEFEKEDQKTLQALVEHQSSMPNEHFALPINRLLPVFGIGQNFENLLMGIAGATEAPANLELPSGGQIRRLIVPAADPSHWTGLWNGFDFIRIGLGPERASPPNSLAFDFLYSGDGRLLAIFPYEGTDSWLNLTPYYFDPTPWHNEPVETAVAAFHQTVWADQTIIQDYLAIHKDLSPYPINSNPFAAIRWSSEEAKWETHPFPSAEESPIPWGSAQRFGKEIQQGIIPVFPWVYSPAGYGIAAEDSGYYSSLGGPIFDLREGETLLVIGGGSGSDVWLGAMQTRNTVYVVVPTELEKVNVEATAATLGFSVKVIVGNNVVDSEGTSWFPDVNFDAIAWNMPYLETMNEKQSALEILMEVLDGQIGIETLNGKLIKGLHPGNPRLLHDGDPNGTTLKRFLQGLLAVWSINGSNNRSLIWNHPKEAVKTIIEQAAWLDTAMVHQGTWLIRPKSLTEVSNSKGDIPSPKPASDTSLLIKQIADLTHSLHKKLSGIKNTEERYWKIQTESLRKKNQGLRRLDKDLAHQIKRAEEEADLIGQLLDELWLSPIPLSAREKLQTAFQDISNQRKSLLSALPLLDTLLDLWSKDMAMVEGTLPVSSMSWSATKKIMLSPVHAKPSNVGSEEMTAPMIDLPQTEDIFPTKPAAKNPLLTKNALWIVAALLLLAIFAISLMAHFRPDLFSNAWSMLIKAIGLAGGASMAAVITSNPPTLISHARTIVILRALGMEYKTIGLELGFAERSIKSSMAAIIQLFGANNILEAFIKIKPPLSEEEINRFIIPDKLLKNQLPPRVMEVWGFLASDLSNEEIAGKMGISAGTVKGYIKQLSEAIGANNRTHAGALYLLWREENPQAFGGRWPVLQKLYDRVGTGWRGQALAPAVIESLGLLLAIAMGGALLLAMNFPLTLSPPALIGWSAFYLQPMALVTVGLLIFFWHLFHVWNPDVNAGGRGWLRFDFRSAITNPALWAIDVLTLAALPFFAFLPWFLAIPAAVFLPHLIVNTFLHLLGRRGDKQATRNTAHGSSPADNSKRTDSFANELFSMLSKPTPTLPDHPGEYKLPEGYPIALIIDAPAKQGSGLNTYTRNYLKYLLEDQPVELHIISRPKGNNRKLDGIQIRVGRGKVVFHILPEDGRSFTHDFENLIQARHIRAVVTHNHMAKESLWAFQAAKRNNTPTVAYYHSTNDPVFYVRSKQQIAHQMLRLADVIARVTLTTDAEALRMTGIDARRIRAVHPMIDADFGGTTQEYEAGNLKFIEKAYDIRGNYVLFAPHAVLKGKGLMQIVAALNTLKNKKIPVTLVATCGFTKVSYLRKIKEFALEQGLVVKEVKIVDAGEITPFAFDPFPDTRKPDLILIRGGIPHQWMARFYRGLDVTAMVLPTKNEIFSLSMAESWLMGIPVVATRVGGVPEGFAPRAQTLLVPLIENEAAQSNEFARVLEEVLSLSGKQRRDLGLEGASYIRNKFDPTVLIQQHVKILKDIESNQASPPLATGRGTVKFTKTLKERFKFFKSDTRPIEEIAAVEVAPWYEFILGVGFTALLWTAYFGWFAFMHAPPPFAPGEGLAVLSYVTTFFAILMGMHGKGVYLPRKIASQETESHAIEVTLATEIDEAEAYEVYKKGWAYFGNDKMAHFYENQKSQFHELFTRNNVFVAKTKADGRVVGVLLRAQVATEGDPSRLDQYAWKQIATPAQENFHESNPDSSVFFSITRDPGDDWKRDDIPGQLIRGAAALIAKQKPNMHLMTLSPTRLADLPVISRVLIRLLPSLTKYIYDQFSDGHPKFDPTYNLHTGKGAQLAAILSRITRPDSDRPAAYLYGQAEKVAAAEQGLIQFKKFGSPGAPSIGEALGKIFRLGLRFFGPGALVVLITPTMMSAGPAGTFAVLVLGAASAFWAVWEHKHYNQQRIASPSTFMVDWPLGMGGSIAQKDHLIVRDLLTDFLAKGTLGGVKSYESGLDAGLSEKVLELMRSTHMELIASFHLADEDLMESASVREVFGLPPLDKATENAMIDEFKSYFLAYHIQVLMVDARSFQAQRLPIWERMSAALDSLDEIEKESRKAIEAGMKAVWDLLPAAEREKSSGDSVTGKPMKIKKEKKEAPALILDSAPVPGAKQKKKKDGAQTLGEILISKTDLGEKLNRLQAALNDSPVTRIIGELKMFQDVSPIGNELEEALIELMIAAFLGIGWKNTGAGNLAKAIANKLQGGLDEMETQLLSVAKAFPDVAEKLGLSIPAEAPAIKEAPRSQTPASSLPGPQSPGDALAKLRGLVYDAGAFRKTRPLIVEWVGLILNADRDGDRDAIVRLFEFAAGETTDEDPIRNTVQMEMTRFMSEQPSVWIPVILSLGEEGAQGIERNDRLRRWVTDALENINQPQALIDLYLGAQTGIAWKWVVERFEALVTGLNADERVALLALETLTNRKVEPLHVIVQSATADTTKALQQLEQLFVEFGQKESEETAAKPNTRPAPPQIRNRKELEDSLRGLLKVDPKLVLLYISRQRGRIGYKRFIKSLVSIGLPLPTPATVPMLGGENMEALLKGDNSGLSLVAVDVLASWLGGLRGDVGTRRKMIEDFAKLIDEAGIYWRNESAFLDLQNIPNNELRYRVWTLTMPRHSEELARIVRDNAKRQEIVTLLLRLSEDIPKDMASEALQTADLTAIVLDESGLFRSDPQTFLKILTIKSSPLRHRLFYYTVLHDVRKSADEGKVREPDERRLLIDALLAANPSQADQILELFKKLDQGDYENKDVEVQRTALYETIFTLLHEELDLVAERGFIRHSDSENRLVEFLIKALIDLPIEQTLYLREIPSELHLALPVNTAQYNRILQLEELLIAMRKAESAYDRQAPELRNSLLIQAQGWLNRILRTSYMHNHSLSNILWNYNQQRPDLPKLLPLLDSRSSLIRHSVQNILLQSWIEHVKQWAATDNKDTSDISRMTEEFTRPLEEGGLSPLAESHYREALIDFAALSTTGVIADVTDAVARFLMNRFEASIRTSPDDAVREGVGIAYLARLSSPSRRDAILRLTTGKIDSIKESSNGAPMARTILENPEGWLRHQGDANLARALSRDPAQARGNTRDRLLWKPTTNEWEDNGLGALIALAADPEALLKESISLETIESHIRGTMDFEPFLQEFLDTLEQYDDSPEGRRAFAKGVEFAIQAALHNPQAVMNLATVPGWKRSKARQETQARVVYETISHMDGFFFQALNRLMIGDATKWGMLFGNFIASATAHEEHSDFLRIPTLEKILRDVVTTTVNAVRDFNIDPNSKNFGQTVARLRSNDDLGFMDSFEINAEFPDRLIAFLQGVAEGNELTLDAELAPAQEACRMIREFIEDPSESRLFAFHYALNLFKPLNTTITNKRRTANKINRNLNDIVRIFQKTADDMAFHLKGNEHALAEIQKASSKLDATLAEIEKEWLIIRESVIKNKKSLRRVGGRWPVLQKLYDRVGTGWRGQALAPAVIESLGLLLAIAMGGALLLAMNFPLTLSPPALIGWSAFYLQPMALVTVGLLIFFWHLFHVWNPDVNAGGRGWLRFDFRSAITNPALWAIDVLTLAALPFFAFLPWFLAIPAAVFLPHLIVNTFLHLLGRQGDWSTVREAARRLQIPQSARRWVTAGLILTAVLVPGGAVMLVPFVFGMALPPGFKWRFLTPRSGGHSRKIYSWDISARFREIKDTYNWENDWDNVYLTIRPNQVGVRVDPKGNDLVFTLGRGPYNIINVDNAMQKLERYLQLGPDAFMPPPMIMLPMAASLTGGSVLGASLFSSFFGAGVSPLSAGLIAIGAGYMAGSIAFWISYIIVSAKSGERDDSHEGAVRGDGSGRIVYAAGVGMLVGVLSGWLVYTLLTAPDAESHVPGILALGMFWGIPRLLLTNRSGGYRRLIYPQDELIKTLDQFAVRNNKSDFSIIVSKTDKKGITIIEKDKTLYIAVGPEDHDPMEVVWVLLTLQLDYFNKPKGPTEPLALIPALRKQFGSFGNTRLYAYAVGPLTESFGLFGLLLSLPAAVFHPTFRNEFPRIARNAPRILRLSRGIGYHGWPALILMLSTLPSAAIGSSAWVFVGAGTAAFVLMSADFVFRGHPGQRQGAWRLTLVNGFVYSAATLVIAATQSPVAGAAVLSLLLITHPAVNMIQTRTEPTAAQIARLKDEVIDLNARAIFEDISPEEKARLMDKLLSGSNLRLGLKDGSVARTVEYWAAILGEGSTLVPVAEETPDRDLEILVRYVAEHYRDAEGPVGVLAAQNVETKDRIDAIVRDRGWESTVKVYAAPNAFRATEAAGAKRYLFDLQAAKGALRNRVSFFGLKVLSTATVDIVNENAIRGAVVMALDAWLKEAPLSPADWNALRAIAEAIQKSA